MNPFVGRSAELDRLRSRFREAAGGRGRVVFVTGEAGAGKSTLVEQFLLEVATGPEGAKVVDAACSEQFGAAEPLTPFIEAFRELLATEGRAGGKFSLMDFAKEVAPTWISALPVVGNVLEAGIVTVMAVKGQTGGATATAQKAPSEEALFFQYTEILQAAAAEKPIVLFLDDLHWADRASISLLVHVARRLEETPVFILGTYRPVDVEADDHPLRQARQELLRYGIAEEIRLGGLGSEALEQLLQERLGSPPSPRLREWLERRAGENPLFFGELLAWLVDQGHAAERDGEWDLVHAPDEVEIPSSAEAALERRLERLDPEEYRILEHASVEGDIFHGLVLSRLLQLDELALEEALGPLERTHELIRLVETRDLPGGEISSMYLFSHSLIQDILHAKLQGKRRILLHRRTAEILLELYDGDTRSVDAELSVHFDEGRIPERAYEFALRAATRASDMYAHLDAAEMFRLALRNAPDDAARILVLQRMADGLRLTGRFDEARARLAEALQLAEAGGDARASLALRRVQLEMDLEQGRRPAPRILDELKQRIREARELGANEDLCRLLWSLRRLPASISASEATYAALERARAIAESTGDPGMQAKAEYELAGSLMMRGQPSDAVPHLERALASCEDSGDRFRAGACYNALAICHLMVGEWPSAVSDFDAAVAAFQDVGDPANVSSVRNNLGGLLTRMGEWERAEASLKEALRVARRLSSRSRVFYPLHNLAEHYEDRGMPEAAHEQWTALAEAARETGFTENVVIAECGVGLGLLEAGDRAGARAALERGETALGDAGPWTQAREAHHRLAARLAAASGDPGGALVLVREALGALAGRDRYEWARFRLLEAEILAAGGDAAAEAETAAREARDAFRELGAAPMAERAEEQLRQMGGPR